MADSEQPSEPAATAPVAATPPAAAPPPATTLGEVLRTTRLSQDLSLEQLSTELRIEAKQLRALEDNRFEQIGVPVFVKGYLKQYGTRLGLNVTELLALYHKQTTLAEIQIQPSRTIKLHDERQIASWVIAVIVLLVLAAGLAAWWWTGGTFAIPASLTTEPAAQSAPASGAAEEVESQAPASPAPRAAPREALPAVDPPAAPAVAPGIEQPAPVAVPAAAVAEQSATAASPLAAPVVAIPLQFTFEQESWAEVTDARGERLLFGLNAAGRDITVRGEPPFAIVLGNADSVRLLVDGAPYSIPTVGRQGDLARFAVDIAEE